MPRRIRGDRAFGRLIKLLPSQVRHELVGQLKVTGSQIVSQQRSLAPFKTGAAKGALTYRVLPTSIRLKVGIIGKPLNRKLFYAHVVEFGRKGGGRGVKRGSAKYNAGVGAMKPRNFIFFPRDQLYAPFRNIWNRALAKASAGITDV